MNDSESKETRAKERHVRYAVLLANTRWFWTLMVPLLMVGAMTTLGEHDQRWEMVSCFNLVMFTFHSVRAWLFKARMDRHEEIT